MKKMQKRRNIIALFLVVVLSLGGISVIFAEELQEAAQYLANQVTELVTGEPAWVIQATQEEEQAQQLEAEQLHERAEMITLDDAIEARLEESKGTKATKGFKMILAEKPLTMEQQERLSTYVASAVDTTALYTLYECLYNGFYTYADLDDALARLAEGEPLAQIVNSYFENSASAGLREYAEGELLRYYDELHLTFQDLYMLEVLSERGVISFETVITRVEEGEKFRDICEELGVLNLEGNIQSVSLSSAEIDMCMEQLGLSEDEAASAIIRAKAAKVPASKVMSHIQSGADDGESLVEYYRAKFEQ